jgi:hypothetical protein
MHARYKREHGSDGAHRISTTRGEDTWPNLSPRLGNEYEEAANERQNQT